MQNQLAIKDIARLSGVGKSKVSRVLNNESGVSQRTRERLAVMNQHGFSPSCFCARYAWAKRQSGRHHCYPAWIFVVRKSRRSNHAEQGYDPITGKSVFPRISCRTSKRNGVISTA